MCIFHNPGQCNYFYLLERDGTEKVDELREQIKSELKDKVNSVDCSVAVCCCYVGYAFVLRNVNVIKDESLDIACLEGNLLRVLTGFASIT